MNEIKANKNESFLPRTYTPQKVFLDFEMSIHTAVKEVWPRTSVEGCHFHLGQSWFRKIQKLGLTRVYRSKTTDGSFLRSFFGLSFGGPNNLEDFSIEEFMRMEPSNNKYTNFLNTFTIIISLLMHGSHLLSGQSTHHYSIVLLMLRRIIRLLKRHVLSCTPSHLLIDRYYIRAARESLYENVIISYHNIEKEN